MSRPGCSDLSSQLHVLNEALTNAGRGKQVVLFDDGICSGGTVAFAKMQLRQIGVEINETTSLARSNDENEVLDLRDFIIGRKGKGRNGLVVQFSNSMIARVPYILPFVDPCDRASITDPLNFSSRVWELNSQIYSGETLREACGEKSPYELLGFSQDDKVSHICTTFAMELSYLLSEHSKKIVAIVNACSAHTELSALLLRQPQVPLMKLVEMRTAADLLIHRQSNGRKIAILVLLVSERQDIGGLFGILEDLSKFEDVFKVVLCSSHLETSRFRLDSLKKGAHTIMSRPEVIFECIRRVHQVTNQLSEIEPVDLVCPR